MRPANPVLLSIVAALAAGMAACDDGAHPAGESAPSSAPAVVRAAPSPAPAASDSATSHPNGTLCHDDDEATALACAGGIAWRHEDTLFVRTAHGVRRMAETTSTGDGDDGYQSYRYAGTVRSHGTHHLIDRAAFEDRWTELLSGQGGAPIRLASFPVLAPGGDYLAAAERGLDNCDFAQPAHEVWRLTDGIPIRDWHLEPWDCKAEGGWGPDSLTWVSADTLRLIHVPAPAADQGPTPLTLPYRQPVVPESAPAVADTERSVLVVRRPAGWVLVDAPASGPGSTSP